MIFVGQILMTSTKVRLVVRDEYRAELEAEESWSASFANSQDVLLKLADKARANYLAGKTELLDPDTL